jgi:hypothetical protein
VPANLPLPLFRDVIPSPWSLDEFRVKVERHRHARLLIAAAPLRLGISGLWIVTTAGDLIVYNEAVNPAQQLRAIGHQAAHLLLGHQAMPSASASQALFPHLATSFAAAVLPISSFAPADEMAADEFASLLVARALPSGEPGPSGGTHDEAADH